MTHAPAPASPAFPPDALRACVERVAASPQFVRSRRLSHFLRFTVEALLEGRADQLKERTIAVEVYGRRLDYDPRVDPIVRSEAHRLRAKLEAYYAREGASDPIVIEYARGCYLPAFRRQAPAASPRAAELFRKAHLGVLQYANSRQQEYLEPARQRLLRAVEAEPGFADALAELAFLELLQLNPPQAPAARLIARATEFVERALAADPRHVRSLCLLGDVHGASGRARQGLELTETAVALAPEDAEARSFLALRYASLGFYEAAVAACDEALRLDPVWELAHQAKALYSGQCGDTDTALAALAELHRVAAPSPLSGAILAGVLVARGDLAGAERALSDARARLSPQQDASYVEILAGLVAALRGDEASARRVFDAQRRSPPRIFDHLLRLSLALGECDAALAQLEASPYHRSYRWLASEPLAQPFLREPGFRRLLEELHAEWQRDLESLGPRLPVAPPELPVPARLRAERVR